MISIEELQTFFSSISLPDTVHVEQDEKIINVPAFVENHLKVLKVNGNEPAYSVFFDRLIELRNILQIQMNLGDREVPDAVC